MLKKAYIHLPGLFEFYELYKVFLPLFYENREYFYDYIEIGSVYGAPQNCIWGGGRIESNCENINSVASLMREYNISSRITFSNSLIKEEHLNDRECNKVCEIFQNNGVENGIIIYSDLLLTHIKKHFPEFYFVSSTTKVLTDFNDLRDEINRPEFRYVVPDFRLNRDFKNLNLLNENEKAKVEFLCNECCNPGCTDRKTCYESVSHIALMDDAPVHRCKSKGSEEGYVFSKAMENPCFISTGDIESVYMNSGFSNFKIEGRSLGSALVLEFLLYYMTKSEYQLKVREKIYLNHSLDLF